MIKLKNIVPSGSESEVSMKMEMQQVPSHPNSVSVVSFQDVCTRTVLKGEKIDSYFHEK